MRYFIVIPLLLLLLVFSVAAFGDEPPVITEITEFREGNLTCEEAREKLQGVVGEYFDLDQELEEASIALAFMDEPTQLRARADFLEKVAAMGDRMSLSWIDCVKACEE